MVELTIADFCERVRKGESVSRFDFSLGFTWTRENVKALLSVVAELRAKGTWANLTGANLMWANLMWANLTGANLTWANLTGANLTEANLTWANLTEANLTWANLTGANLTWANLMWANLTRANLMWANLMWANLTGANLTDIRQRTPSASPSRSVAAFASLRFSQLSKPTRTRRTT